MTDQQFITTGYVLVVLSIIVLVRTLAGRTNLLVWVIAICWPVVLVIYLLACIYFYFFDYEL
jgi:hypothetical protein